MTGTEDDTVEGFLEALLDDDPQTLYDRAPCGYLSTTPDGTILKANATFLDLTGYSREALVGRKRFVDLLTAGGRIYHETHYAPMLQMQGSAREIALELICADQRRLPVLVNSVLEKDRAGNPSVIRTAVFDATDRRSYEEELLRQMKRAEQSEARATALARTLQQTLIPPHLPVIDGIDVGAEYRPAGDGSEVGGDFYDFFQAGDDWVIAIGDVCGKGAEAAVVTALARYTLRAAAVQDASPARALTLLNEALLRADVDRFCTAAVLRLGRTEGGWVASVCAAGHSLPIHVAEDGHVAQLGMAGPLLGVLDEVELTDTTAELAVGDLLVAYTDGVTEARSPGGDFFGEVPILGFVSAGSGSAPEIARSLLEAVVAFQEGHVRDDIAIVAVGIR
ncbi:MAG TPA: SpoIIE family protein phosphatase [Mycobacteriales bacterium]|nr:SpoIIE family protein phosphatase [Mycobacteriales bacterium]